MLILVGVAGPFVAANVAWALLPYVSIKAAAAVLLVLLIGYLTCCGWLLISLLRAPSPRAPPVQAFWTLPRKSKIYFFATAGLLSFVLVVATTYPDLSPSVLIPKILGSAAALAALFWFLDKLGRPRSDEPGR
jgi:hypothetical protein